MNNSLLEEINELENWNYYKKSDLYEKLNLKDNICFCRNDKHDEFYFVWFLTCQLYHSDIMSNIIHKVKV